MAYIIESLNPFEPFKIKKTEHAGDVTVWTILKWMNPKFDGRFEVPTVIVINGEGIKSEEWKIKILGPNDVMNIVVLPGGPLAIVWILVIVVIALSVAFALTIPTPTTPGEQPGSDPVFSLKGQQNAIRLGEPIECPYGRNRIFPSLATRPYYQYVDNDQFQYAIFCVGQGSYDIEEVMIGDSPIEDFQEAEYDIIEPGETTFLFPENVLTAVEVGGQTLFAPNDEEYIAPGWVGPFAANPPGTVCTKIDVDLIFPRGLFELNEDGASTDLEQVTVEIEYREIDDDGDPVGAGTWEEFTIPFPFVYEAQTSTPQRRTYGRGVTPGRYEVRARRPNPRVISQKNGNEVIWEALRSYVEGPETWGDVTLIALKIRATSNLNERTQMKFNVIATRKLEIYDPNTETWSARTATRSIVWAFVDIFRADYGGKLPDNFIDWEKLVELDAFYITREEYFDWVFRDMITVWEAARTVARVGRAIPLLLGSLVTMRRDEEQEVPVTLFNTECMVAGSFQWDVKMRNILDHDSLRVEYTEPSTGYKQEQVLCTLPGGTTDNPKDLRIPGIQDRDHAYREGLYILACEKYLRENITFETGLEGYIPSYGDLVLIAHDTPRWGQSGYIVQSEEIEGELGIKIWTSEPLDWSVGSPVMLLRGAQGQVSGPYVVTQGDNAQQALLPWLEAYNFFTGGESEPMLYIFGDFLSITKHARVTRIEPSGGESIRITCVNDDPTIYSFDEETPPPLESLMRRAKRLEFGSKKHRAAVEQWKKKDGTEAGLRKLETPEVKKFRAPIGTMSALEESSFIFLNQAPTVPPTAQVIWTPIPGANEYLVQSSADGDVWKDEVRTTRAAATFPAPPGLLYARVAALYPEGPGPWKESSITVSGVGGLGLETEFTGLSWKISWSAVPNALDYRVRVYDASATALVLERTDTVLVDAREYEYDFADATADGNVNRDMVVDVTPRYPGGFGDPVQLELHNPIPAAPTGLGHSLQASDASTRTYRLVWTNPEDADLVMVRVWSSATDGFTPGGSPDFEDIAVTPGHANVDEQYDLVVALSGGTHAARYWRVAVYDVWGIELSTNLSGQQTIPAHP
jgi:hypothetical protein